MTIGRDINGIINSLRESGIIHYNTKFLDTMKGTTDGCVHPLTVNNEPQYVLKIDDEQSISLVSQLHEAYSKSPLLSRLIYTDPSKAFLVYSYISGQPIIIGG